MVVHCVSFRQPTASYSVSCPLCAIPSAHCLLFRQMVVHCVPFRQPTASCSVKWLFIVCHSVSPLSPVPSNSWSLCAIPSAHCLLYSVKWLFIVCHSVSPLPPVPSKGCLLCAIPSAHCRLFRQMVVHCVSFRQTKASIPSKGCSLCAIPSTHGLLYSVKCSLICHCVPFNRKNSAIPSSEHTLAYHTTLISAKTVLSPVCASLLYYVLCTSFILKISLRVHTAAQLLIINFF